MEAGLAQVVGEVGGRFSAETTQFLLCLASAKMRDVPQLLQRGVDEAATARASAFFLHDRDCSSGVDGHTPSVHEVLGGGGGWATCVSPAQKKKKVGCAADGTPHILQERARSSCEPTPPNTTVAVWERKHTWQYLQQHANATCWSSPCESCRCSEGASMEWRLQQESSVAVRNSFQQSTFLCSTTQAAETCGVATVAVEGQESLMHRGMFPQSSVLKAADVTQLQHIDPVATVSPACV